MPPGASFYEDVPLMECMHLVFTRTPGGVTVGDSGLCCCVPSLPASVISVHFSVRQERKRKGWRRSDKGRGERMESPKKRKD